MSAKRHPKRQLEASHAELNESSTDELWVALKCLSIPFEPSASKVDGSNTDDNEPPEILDIHESVNLTGLPSQYGPRIPEDADIQDVVFFHEDRDRLSVDEYIEMMAHSSGDGEPRENNNRLESYRITKRHTDLLDKLVTRKSAHTLSTFAGFITSARDISGMRVITEETATLSLGFSGLRFSPVTVDHGQANYEVTLKEAHQSVYLIIKPSRQLSSDLKELVALYLKQLTVVDSISELRIALYTCLALLGCMMDDTDADELVYHLACKHKIANDNPMGELTPASGSGAMKGRAILVRLCRSIGGQNHSKADVVEEEFANKL